MKILLLLLLAAPVFAAEPLTQEALGEQTIPAPAPAENAASISTGTATQADGDIDADAGFNEILNEAFQVLGDRAGLDYEMTVTGVHFGDRRNTRLEDGSYSIAVPEHIDQVTLENIRVRESETPSMGNVFMQNIDINHSEIIVTPR